LSEVSSEQKTSTDTGNNAQPTPSVQQPDQGGNASQEVEAAVDEREADDVPQLDDIGMDVNMEGLDDAQEQDGNQDSNDWVMIEQEAGQGEGDQDIPDLPNENQPGGDQDRAEQNNNATPAATTSSQQEEQAQPAPDTGLDTPDFDMGGDFDNVDVDTAGDALASYGNDGDDLNLDNVEDSAFGDAFHPEEDDIS
jgi:hypothetical protein